MSKPSPDQQQVVVGYDFSRAGMVVLDRAIELACRAPFHFLHVVTVIDPRLGVAAIPSDTGIDYRYADKVEHEVTRLVTAILVANRAPHDVQFFVHARIGKPARAILNLAEEIGADLIMVGSHNSLGVRRLLLGSTSERVVREAGCPVIVARPKTYKRVVRTEMIEIEPRHHYVPPHRYHYDDNRVMSRPADFPLL